MSDSIKPNYYKLIIDDDYIELKDIINNSFLAENYNLATAFVYLIRAGKKPENSFIQDVSKAIKHLEFELERITPTTQYQRERLLYKGKPIELKYFPVVIPIFCALKQILNGEPHQYYNNLINAISVLEGLVTSMTPLSQTPKTEIDLVESLD